MKELTELEQKYINDCLEELEIFRARSKFFCGLDSEKIVEDVASIVANDMALPNISGEAKKQLEGYVSEKITGNKVQIEVVDDVIDAFISLSNGIEKEQGNRYVLLISEFSDFLVQLLERNKDDKKYYQDRELKVDFLVLTLIERNIANGLIEEIEGLYERVKGDKKYWEEFYNSLYVSAWQNYEMDILNYLNNCDSVEELSDDEYHRIVERLIKPFMRVIEPYRVIRDHYFNKLDSFSKDDMGQVMGALRTMEINDTVCSIIRNGLRKKIVVKPKEKLVSEIKKPERVVRSINDVNRELLKYYDLNKREITTTKYITSEEVISCVMLLNELKVDKGEIEFFVNEVNLFNDNSRSRLIDGERVNKVTRVLVEYPQDEQELFKYYDLEKKKIVAKEYVTKEEVVNCVFILKKLHASTEEIETFLNQINQFNKVILEMDPEAEFRVKDDAVYAVQRFQDLSKKLEFYSQSCIFTVPFENLVENYNDCLAIELETFDDCLYYFEYQKDLEISLNVDLKCIVPYNTAEFEIGEALLRGSKPNFKVKRKVK